MITPRRVVVNSEGYAVAPRLAFAEYGVRPTIVFIRVDGWSLGSPDDYEEIAYKQWASEWTHFVREGQTKWSPIRDYTPKKGTQL